MYVVKAVKRHCFSESWGNLDSPSWLSVPCQQHSSPPNPPAPTGPVLNVRHLCALESPLSLDAVAKHNGSSLFRLDSTQLGPARPGPNFSRFMFLGIFLPCQRIIMDIRRQECTIYAESAHHELAILADIMSIAQMIIGTYRPPASKYCPRHLALPSCPSPDRPR